MIALQLPKKQTKNAQSALTLHSDRSGSYQVGFVGHQNGGLGFGFIVFSQFFQDEFGFVECLPAGEKCAVSGQVPKECLTNVLNESHMTGFGFRLPFG